MAELRFEVRVVKIYVFPMLTGHIKLPSIDLVNKCVLIFLGPGWLFGTANTIESKRETPAVELVNGVRTEKAQDGPILGIRV